MWSSQLSDGDRLHRVGETESPPSGDNNDNQNDISPARPVKGQQQLSMGGLIGIVELNYFNSRIM